MKITGLAILSLATLVSFLIANIPTESDPGLGGLILWFWPPIVGVISILVFLISCALTKNKKIRFVVSALLALYLIYIGLGLYVDKDWPLVYW